MRILTKGEVVARVRGEVDSDRVTVMDVVGTAAPMEADVTVGGGCVVVVGEVVEAVVATVVGAAQAVEGRGVRFLVGGGMVGVGGMILTAEKHTRISTGRKR